MTPNDSCNTPSAVNVRPHTPACTRGPHPGGQQLSVFFIWFSTVINFIPSTRRFHTLASLLWAPLLQRLALLLRLMLLLLWLHLLMMCLLHPPEARVCAPCLVRCTQPEQPSIILLDGIALQKPGRFDCLPALDAHLLSADGPAVIGLDLRCQVSEGSHCKPHEPPAVAGLDMDGRTLAACVRTRADERHGCARVG